MGENYDENIVSICSVSQMAQKLGLSRARLYQLIETGIFPPPFLYRNHSKRRPFYTAEFQKMCLEIRNTGIGYNRQPIVFNNKKKSRSQKAHIKKFTTDYSKFIDALAELKLIVTSTEVQNAINQLYPDSNEPLDFNGNTVADLYRYFNRGV